MHRRCWGGKGRDGDDVDKILMYEILKKSFNDINQKNRFSISMLQRELKTVDLNRIKIRVQIDCKYFPINILVTAPTSA